MGYRKLIVLLCLVSHALFLNAQTLKCLVFIDNETKSEVSFVSIGILEGDIVIRVIEKNNNCYAIQNTNDSVILAASGYDDIVIKANDLILEDTIYLIPEYRTLYPVNIKVKNKRNKLIRIGQRNSMVYSQIPLLPDLSAYVTFSTETIKKNLFLESFEFEIHSNSYLNDATLAIRIYPLSYYSGDWNEMKLQEILDSEKNENAIFKDTFLLLQGLTGWYKIPTLNFALDKKKYIIELKVLSKEKATEVKNWSEIHSSKICRYDTNCICLRTNSRKSKYFGPIFYYKYPYHDGIYNYYEYKYFAPRFILNFKYHR